MKTKKSSIVYGILFGLLAILVLFVSLFFTYVYHMMYGLGLASSAFGIAVVMAGTFTVIVALIGVILGMINLRKGKKKVAFFFVLLGVIYGGLIYGGAMLDDALDTARLEQSVANRMEENYGEDWNAPSAIEGVPEQYQTVLNQFYVAVKEQWPAEKLMDLGAVSMPGYYGGAALENIGFALVDLNGDRVDELVIGAAGNNEATAVFCIYTDPNDPFYAINSVEERLYYLHSGEVEGTYEAEIVDLDAAFVIAAAQAENTFDFDYREGAMDPANRMTLELIPFAQYK